MIIKDWWYAIKVCRKYGILWNPFRDLSNASFYCRWDDNGKIITRKIHMSPFYPKFLETFMHEVGHITLYKRGTAQKLYRVANSNVNIGKEYIMYNGKPMLALLVEESLASRFSRKSLKGKADVNDLVRAFQTYSAWAYSQLLRTSPEDANTITRLTNFVEAGIRRIEK